MIYMTACTFVLCNEIESLKLPQKEIAKTFAQALRSEYAGVYRTDWEKVGTAALNRWGPSGWRRLKEMGHRIHDRSKQLT